MPRGLNDPDVRAVVERLPRVMAGHETRWLGELTDQEIADRLVFTIGWMGSTCPVWWDARCEASSLRVWIAPDRIHRDPPTLQGKALIAAVREVLQIPRPGETPRLL